MLVDGHADTISKIMRDGSSLYSNQCHFDVQRAITAGVQMQVLALFTHEKISSKANEIIRQQIEYFDKQLDDCFDCAFQITEGTQMGNLNDKQVGLMLHLEGGDAIGQDLSELQNLHSKGVRSLGLTWNYGNAIASGILDVQPNCGLTAFGREVVRELNKLNMVVDAAHASHKTFYDILEHSKSPIWVSHANAFALCRHPRNLTDDQLKSIKDIGGVVGICFVPDFTGPDADIEGLADHVCYICELIGTGHVALGSDFDGTDITVIPDVSHLNEFTGLLERRLFSANEIKKITGGNLFRLLKQVL